VYPTTEVRWFQAGEIPSRDWKWFKNCPGPVQNQLTRIDYYLPLSFTGDLGVKVREGQLEIKILREKLGVGRLHERVLGDLQCWQKWAFNVEGTDDPSDNSEQPFFGWLPVQKSRSLRRYHLDEVGGVVPAAGEDISPGSCGLEMTSIQFQGLFWWSLAFETYGLGKDSRSLLKLIAAQLFDIGEPPSLLEVDSMSYPGWLSHLVS
jgi:hypothetical protein